MTDVTTVYVAGHRGLVGSALTRRLQARGRIGPSQSEVRVIGRTHQELDLTDGAAVHDFMQAERPDYVMLAAARVGGIHANDTYPAEFILSNLAIQTNVIHEAWRAGVKRLLFLGSSCIYPRDCPQPMKEEYLLTGPLEPTNRPYALAKIAGIEMCWSYNRQYGTHFLAVMPTNLYGPHDNYHPTNSHVIPALIRRFHEAKTSGAPGVTIWGTGTPRREFMNSEDMADACLHIMDLPDERFVPLLAADRNDGLPPLLNIGVGKDITISELACLIARVVGYEGDVTFDPSKPDGTPRKLMDTSRLNALGWHASIPLERGLELAYEDFKHLTSSK